jgi:hypothetical protein
MCPLCIYAGALIAAGSASSGGLAALLLCGTWRNRKKDEDNDQSSRDA